MPATNVSLSAFRAGRFVALALIACMSLTVFAATKKEDKEGKKPKPRKESDPGEIFRSTSDTAKLETAANASAQRTIDELNSRALPISPEINLDVEWYSPHLDVTAAGNIVKGWVREDLVLLETSKHNLIAVRRSDGVDLWRCELSGAIRYSPAVSRNNIVVNINNTLVAIERNGGNVRWKLTPEFVMSSDPIVVDPPSYPLGYTRQWEKLENIYVGTWDGKFHAVHVRARTMNFAGARPGADALMAPEFDLFPVWHKNLTNRGAVTGQPALKDGIVYYCSDNHFCYAVSREGEEREPYYMLAAATTPATVTNASVYVGARDNYIYCLDRLTMRKKWAYAAGFAANGTIMADEAATPLVYVSTDDGLLNALYVTPGKAGTKTEIERLEAYKPLWQVKAAGAICAGPDVVYVGLAREKDFNAFKGIAAIEKATGKTLWQSDGAGLTSLFEFHNSWSNPTQAARVYGITSDNRVVSLKEKVRNTGVQVFKMPEPEADPKAAPTKKKTDTAAPPGADAPADGKGEAPKAEEKKAPETK